MAVVATREQWVEAATEFLGTPIADAVPVARRRRYAWLVDVAGTLVVAAVVLLTWFVWRGQHPLFWSLATVASFGVTRLQAESRFIALSSEGGLWLLTATTWFPRPTGPIGPLDPGQVSGPVGLFRLTFVIAGGKHQVALPHKKSLQRIVDTARRAPTG